MLRQLPLVERIPVAEIADGIVLNVDGSLASGFEVLAVDYTSSPDEHLATICNGISELLRRLPDGYTLQLLLDCDETTPPIVADYIASRRALRARSDAAGLLATDSAAAAAKARYRRQRVFLFVCDPYSFQNDSLVRAGALPIAFPTMPHERYARAEKRLKEVASSSAAHLRALGLGATRATDDALLELVSRQLNPARAVPAPKDGSGHDASAPNGERALDGRLTLRERLACTDFHCPSPELLVAGDVGIRTLSLKALPDQTSSTMLGGLYFELPPPYRLSISIEKLPAERALAGLKMRRSIAEGIAALSARRNIDAEVQHAEVEQLLEALSGSELCLCAAQLTCTLFGRSQEELWERTQHATQTFARAGGLSVLVEDYNHLDVYMSQLPGASHRFRRSRTVTDRNASHLLLPFGSWRGHRTGPLLLRTRAGDAVRFDPFADELPAFNGLVVGATGSGKSFFTNLVLAQHMANGGGAVVVDIGGSYRRIANLFGGTYVDVGQSDSIGLNPLPSLAALNALPETLRDQKLLFLGGFLELLLTEAGAMGTLERALIAKTLAAFYDPARGASTAPPTLNEIQDFIRDSASLEREGAQRLARRLDLWVRGPRARLFSRPIDLDLKPQVIAIDLKAVESDPELQAVALYVLGFVVWSKLAESATSGRHTMVVFDECWALLSNAPAARLIENLVRTSRKYGAGIWCLSQSVADFSQASIGPALLSNAYSRVLLRHAFGHAQVAELMGLNAHSLAAFETLNSVRGEYAEAFLQSGGHAELVQVVPSPLAYWIATTNAKDKALEQATREKNPSASPMRILRTLATHFPGGVQ